VNPPTAGRAPRPIRIAWTGPVEPDGDVPEVEQLAAQDAFRRSSIEVVPRPIETLDVSVICASILTGTSAAKSQWTM
jgi:hypothetical protein